MYPYLSNPKPLEPQIIGSTSIICAKITILDNSTLNSISANLKILHHSFFLQKSSPCTNVTTIPPSIICFVGGIELKLEDILGCCWPCLVGGVLTMACCASGLLYIHPPVCVYPRAQCCTLSSVVLFSQTTFSLQAASPVYCQNAIMSHTGPYFV